jgi:MurNAc alpha-1-phosphate uridylyltransferase
MVSNPEHHPSGDFGLHNQRLQLKQLQQPSFTYSGMGLFHPRLFADYAAGSSQRLALRPLFEQAIARRRIAATVCAAAWTDVGTPERWQMLSREQ